MTTSTDVSRAGSVPSGDDPREFICNVVPSRATEQDWRFTDSLESGVLGEEAEPPASVDLRAPWWTVNSQESTGSCVGWATADGLVRYHLVKAGRLKENTMLSPRFVWMASKETDAITGRPETFIEQAGTTLKAAIDVVRKFGAALQTDLPFHIATNMFAGNENAFYAGCAQRRVASYFNLGLDLTDWKTWLASQGPILAALRVDASWDHATANAGRIDVFQPATVRGGHAICIVGYGTDGRFIVRNSWGTEWGDSGFGYLAPDYITEAFFNESYGTTV